MRHRPAPVRGRPDGSNRSRFRVVLPATIRFRSPSHVAGVVRGLGACRSIKPYGAAIAAWISFGPLVSRSFTPPAGSPTLLPVVPPAARLGRRPTAVVAAAAVTAAVVATAARAAADPVRCTR